MSERQIDVDMFFKSIIDFNLTSYQHQMPTGMAILPNFDDGQNKEKYPLLKL